MLKENWKAVFVLSLGFTIIFYSRPTFAEIDPFKLKGLYNLTTPQYSYLSPIQGCSFYRKVLPNMRWYGNYGAKREGIPCFEVASKTHEFFVKNKDCPQDSTAALIQQLFPSQDGFNFVPNQVFRDPVSHFTPAILGQILSWTSKMNVLDLAQAKKKEKLRQELTDLILQNLDPESYKNTVSNHIDRANVELDKRQRKLNECKDPSRLGALRHEVDTLNVHLIRLNIAWHRIEEEQNAPEEKEKIASSQIVSEVSAKTWKEKDLKPFVDSFLGALMESRDFKDGGVGVAPTTTATYPESTPEQALLGFMCAKIDSKSALLEYLKEMPHALSEQGKKTLHDESIQQSFLKDSFKLEDYLNWNKNVTEQKLATFLAEVQENPEKAIAYAVASTLYDDNLSPVIQYSRAQAIHPKTQAVVSYPDCVETAIRNFFNFMLYDPKKKIFDVSRFKEIQRAFPNLKIKSGLIEFYNKHFRVSEASEKECRDDWSQMVLSNITHPKIRYLTPSKTPFAEISTEIPNVLAVFENLLFSDSSQFNKMSTAHKWDRLKDIFSHNGFQVDWNLTTQLGDLPGPKEKINGEDFESIDFSINGNRSFKWYFSPDGVLGSAHSVVSDYREGISSWRTQAGLALAKGMKGYNKNNLSKIYSLLPWFIGNSNYRLIMDTLEGTVPMTDGMFYIKEYNLIKDRAMYSLPLISNQEKLDAIQTTGVDDGPPRSRILARLPADDLVAQQKLYEIIVLQNRRKPYDPLIFSTPFQKRVVAWESIRMGMGGSLPLLYQHGLPLDGQGFGGSTLLHLAVAMNQYPTVHYLVGLFKDKPEILYQKNQNGETAYELAKKQRRKEILILLKNEGINK